MKYKIGFKKFVVVLFWLVRYFWLYKYKIVLKSKENIKIWLNNLFGKIYILVYEYNYWVIRNDWL